jgi:hypothetical protein
MLVVDYRGVNRCDLVTAAKPALRTSMTIGWHWSFEGLHAYQEPDSEPVRLVAEGPGWILLSATPVARPDHQVPS